MPLRLKCRNCGHQLLLDSAFQGAQCRCQHCHRLIQVPYFPRHTRSRPTQRPDRPPLKMVTPASKAARSVQPNQSQPPDSRPRWIKLMRRRPVLFGTVSLTVVTVCLVACLTSGSQPAASTLIAVADAGTQPTDPSGISRLRGRGSLITETASNESKEGLDYFGVPIKGETIGYVVDGDQTMAPFINDIALATNSVNERIPPGTKRFGIVQAVGGNGRTFLEVHEPGGDLQGSHGVLLSRLPSGSTDLSKALSIATGWYADEVFLVLSKPVEQPELDILRQNAAQTGAVVHVIAFGAAAKQDLSSIARPTGGEFVPVSDGDLKDFVHQQRESLEAKYNH